MSILKLAIFSIGLLLLLSCNANTTENKDSTVVTPISSTAPETKEEITEEVVATQDPLEAAKKVYENFERNKASYRTENTDFICDRGGGFIKYYYDNDQLVSIEVGIGEEFTDRKEFFHLKDGEVCVIYDLNSGVFDDEVDYEEMVYFVHQGQTLETWTKKFKCSESKMKDFVKNTPFSSDKEKREGVLGRYNEIKDLESEDDIYAYFCR